MDEIENDSTTEIYSCGNGHVHFRIPSDHVRHEATSISWGISPSDAIQWANSIYAVVRHLTGGN